MAIFWFRDGRKGDVDWQPHAGKKANSAGVAAYAQVQAHTAVAPVTTLATDAKHLMKSPVKTLSAEATLNEARLFLHSYRVRHVPIVDSSGRLLGIVSDRDLLREAAKSDDSIVEWLSEGIKDSRKLREFMTKNVLTASPGARIRDLARAMLTERIGSIPVVNDDGKVLGIITRSDILRHLVETLPLETSI